MSQEKLQERVLLGSLVVFLVFGCALIWRAPATVTLSQGNSRWQGSIYSFSSGSSDSGGNSATRAAMMNIKCALINYQNDVGFLPFIGSHRSPANYSAADRYCLGDVTGKNVLVATDVGRPFDLGGLDPKTYHKRWKGPYMDCDPSEFMRDSWDNKILYVGKPDGIYLWSSGRNGNFDLLEEVLHDGYDGDDLAVCVTRLKKPPK